MMKWLIFRGHGDNKRPCSGLVERTVSLFAGLLFVLASCGGEGSQANAPPVSLPPSPPVPSPAPPVGNPPPPAPATKPMFGFVPFPFDVTARAQDQLYDIIIPQSEIYAIHMDLFGCVPWKEAINGEPFPAWLEGEFDGMLARVPSSHRIYVSTTPTDQSRVDMVLQCGDVEGQPGAVPAALRGKGYDDPAVIDAYVKFADRVIQRLRPSHFVVGIEISELALKEPGKWPAFERFYIAVFDALKRKHPDVKIAPEMVLQSLLLDRVATQVKPVVEHSDYLGISFYPFGSEFGEMFGAPKLPPPPRQWTEPLTWLESYTEKPIAIAETGYTTRTVNTLGLRFPGSSQLQADFVEDLSGIARDHDYLFVIWFVPVDYTILSGKIPMGDEGKIWEYNGLFDANLQPKPAWTKWRDRHN